MMFETEARRKRIVDARASRQFATQQLAVEAERRGRDRPAAEAGGRIDPLGLLGPPDERRPLTLDVGKQARDGCAIRSSEPPKHGRGRAHFAVLDPRQGSATDPAQRGKFIERPAPRASQCAQAFSEAHIGGVAGWGLGFHIRENTLGNESVKAEFQTPGEARPQFARAALLLHTWSLQQRNGPMSSSHHAASIPAWAWAVG
jgi:hypothetical protein